MSSVAMSRGRRLRIALVLPGGISFGAYEAGVASALLHVVRESGQRVIVDAIVGASCGAITGFLLALALRHEDASRWIEDFWVQRASLAWMLPWAPWIPSRPKVWAPLSTAPLEDWVERMVEEARGSAIQDEPITFIASLANLHGVDVPVPVGLAPRPGVDEVIVRSFRDARGFVLEDDQTEWRSALRATLASSAHPCGFASVAIPDARPNRDEHPSSCTWFTDGGTVDNEPVGLALDAVLDPAFRANQTGAARRDERMLLVVHSGNRQDSTAWAVREHPPTFVESGLRALEMLWAGPSTADDLRRVAEYNQRARARVEIEAALATRCDEVTRELLDRATGTLSNLPMHLLLIGPHDRQTLEGARYANVRGLLSRRARQNDYRRGYADFISSWYGSSPISSCTNESFDAR
ncbi:MAG: patatin-like phospholipase family protein [Polyangiaceae bacterium]